MTMKSLAALDRPSWLSSSAWPWQPYLLSHHQGGIAVTDIGDGPAVLFVHVGSWSFVWRDVLLRLANDFRCVAIDAPGCGLSDRLSTPPTLAQAADAITSVIDALQLRDLTLVAHDLGGPAGFLAAARRGDRVAALAAVNCFAWRPTGPLFRACSRRWAAPPCVNWTRPSMRLPARRRRGSGPVGTGAAQTARLFGRESMRRPAGRGMPTSAMRAVPMPSIPTSTPRCGGVWPIGHC
ncbi:alpha/beta fold hydrolase [Mycobacterium tuberculosis]|uniref:alpha/beta fold hydrolase n=2 Tax=Mycobacterium tuberculosis TaxID=1773 RepID=UPI000ACC9578